MLRGALLAPFLRRCQSTQAPPDPCMVMLHAASSHPSRHSLCQEVHGHVDFPPGFRDDDHPDWVEAAAWMLRQQSLYRHQKMPLLHVRVLKEVLGEQRQCS